MYQTMQEIEKKYDGYWVFMINCQKGELHEIIGGEVIAFDKDKEPVAAFWGRKYNSKTYFRYIGSIPDGVLGMNILEHFNFRVNLDESILELEKR